MKKHLIFSQARFLALLLLGLVATPAAAQQRNRLGLETNPDSIRPGDVVRLTVIREKELTGEFPVNQFGTVVLPLVGEYDVSHETYRSLREKVIRDLEEIRQAKDIELVVLRRVRVVGEVNMPGVYNLDPTLTVADAVAMAKGRTQFAAEGKAILRRGTEVVDADLRLDTPISKSGIISGDEIFVPRRPWADRNMPSILGGGTALLGLALTLILR